MGKIFCDARAECLTLSTMSEPFHQLLDATVAHLEGLKARGVRYVALAPETMALLNGRAVRREPDAAQRAVAMPVSEPPARNGVNSAENPAPISISTPASPSSPVIATTKAAAIEELRARALQCRKCPHLVSARTNVVFGVGNIDADLMFVGEAPGSDEDEQGEPFVGAAGQLLTRMINTMGLARGDVYIANILKCRPDMPRGSTGNRKPTPEEMQTCIPYLHAQIDIIQPKVLVALGGTAVEGLLGKSGITKLRGTWQTYRGIPLMPTYHPAYLLRNQSKAEKRRVWEDLMAVMEKLGLPISEKQRNYFLGAGEGNRTLV